MSEIEPRPWLSSFWMDKAATKPVPDPIEFGEAWAAKTKTINLYIRNDDIAFVRDIKYRTGRTDVTITGPTKLNAGEVGLLKITWMVSPNPRFGLGGELKIDGKLVLVGRPNI